MLWSDLERLGSFWDPWQDFERMRRTLFGDGGLSTTVEFPAVNVWVKDDNAVVTTEISGVDPKTVDISITGKSLTLRGSREPDKAREGYTYHRRERWYGQFSKIIDLPFSVETDKVEARFKNGVLYLELPRAKAEKPKKIAVKSE
jgi:HSP20 family protein